MTHPDDADQKARNTGLVYVLKPHLAGRDTVPFNYNIGTRLLQRLDQTHHFTEPEVRAFIAEIQRDEAKVREWCNAAWTGVPPARRTDTWERVFKVLVARGDHGATSAEVQRATSLGHGAVSGALCRWDQYGVAYRLAPDG
jgi:hypothetical protein